MPERVVINIEVNSDIAEIEATREALRRLRDEEERLNDERERGRRAERESSRERNRTNNDNNRLNNLLNRQNRNLNRLRGRYAGLLKETFAFRQDIGKLIGAVGGFIKLINKLSLIEIPLLAAGLGTISALFAMGPGFIKLYKAAMSGLAYTAAGLAVAVTTAVAAQQEFASVQFAPMYTEGAANTADRFIAASQAMDMFTLNTKLAVVGAESLQKSFATLSKQKAVTGNTVAAFEGLMNVVAGSGGDIGKGSEKLAEFLAKVQKDGLGGAGDVAKELGPDFEKIIKEAKELGVKTSDEFFAAAAEGTLGKTFQEKYAGQLDALNNTLIGRFKQGMTDVKRVLGDLGTQFLQPAGDLFDNIVRQLKITVVRLSPLISQFGTGFFGDVEEAVAKITDKFVVLMNRYLNTTPTFLQQMGKIVDAVGGFGDRLQDWARGFKPAGKALNESFFGPIFEGLKDKFAGGIDVLSDLVLKNKPALEEFAKIIVDLIGAIGDYANMLKEAFFAALPAIGLMLKMMTKLLELFTKLMKGMMALFGKMGGKLGNAIGAIIAIYASITLFSRFFTTLGKMFGKDMSIRANNVFVNGGPVGGPMGAGGAPVGGPMSYQQASAQHMSRQQRIQSAVRGAPAAMGRGLDKMYAMPIGGMLSTAAGMGLMATAGDTSTTGGALKQGAGIALAGGGMLSMMGGQAIKMPGMFQRADGGRNFGRLGSSGGTMGAAGLAGAAAIAGGSYAAGNIIGSKFKNDSKSSRAMSAGSSALAGAAIGAAVGSVVPIIGTGVGAAIGAVVGGISGYMNSGKQQKAAREMGKSLVDNYTQATEEAFAAGDIAALATAREEAIKQHEANLKEVQHMEEYNKHVTAFQLKMEQFDREIEQFTDNAALAERTLGVGTDQLNALAEEAGINLRTKMLSLKDVIQLVGKTTTQQMGLMRAEIAKFTGAVTTGAMNVFEQDRKRRESRKNVDASEAALATGLFNEETVDKFLEDTLMFGTTEAGPLGAFGTMQVAVKESLESGTLKNLTDKQKDAVLARMNEVSSNENILKYIKSDPTAQQELGDLVRTGKGMEKLTNEEIMGLITTKLKDPAMAGQGGFFLQNLLNQIQEDTTSKTGNLKVAGMLLSPDRLAEVNRPKVPMGSYMQPSVLPSAQTSKVVNVSVVSPLADKATVDRIINEIQAAFRDTNERGGVTVGSTGGARRT